ncbi:MAG: hypothetical protein ACQES4_03590 [Bacillota bacterium]
MKKTLFISVVIMFLSLLLVSGCDLPGGAEEDSLLEEDEMNVDPDNPEQVIHDFVDAIRDFDLDRAEELVSSDYLDEFETEYAEIKDTLAEDTPEAVIMKQMFDVVFDHLEITVTGHTLDGDAAMVNTINTHPDPEILTEKLMDRLFEIMFSDEVDMENITEEEGMQMMIDVFRDVYPEVEKITTEVDVPMVRENGQWKIAGEVISDYTVDLDM